MAKEYQISVRNDVQFRHLCHELNEWQVRKNRYRIEGNTIFTVDVATETFIDHPDLLTIHVINL